MSGSDTLAQRAKRFVQGLPGKRGVDIPADTYDRIFQAASGISQQVWGRMPTPEQMQHLYDTGNHTPDQIQKVYGEQPHPHAEGLTVGEYPAYESAYQVMQQHK